MEWGRGLLEQAHDCFFSDPELIAAIRGLAGVPDVPDALIEDRDLFVDLLIVSDSNGCAGSGLNALHELESILLEACP